MKVKRQSKSKIEYLRINEIKRHGKSFAIKVRLNKSQRSNCKQKGKSTAGMQFKARRFCRRAFIGLSLSRGSTFNDRMEWIINTTI